MDRDDPPETQSGFVIPDGGDIPEALREESAPPRPPVPQPRRLLWGVLLGGMGVTAIVGGVAFYLQRINPSLFSSPGGQPPSQIAAPEQPIPPIAQTPAPPIAILGHLPYPEAPGQTLQPIAPGSGVKLRRSAAAKFIAMVTAANADGVALMPISGFRSIADQNYLFFDVKAQQGENAAQRAAVSAPPGYSEHHTGYAIDIGDGSNSNTDLQTSFEKTAAFRWLQANAAHFSFEMSFAKNNAQGVSYEPWHWRFVGDQDSLEIFYRAHSVEAPVSRSSAPPAPQTASPPREQP